MDPLQGKPKLGMLSTLSIGIGGMVGGGIFAVTGLSVQIARGAAPLAFLIAGIVALLTSFSYLKLSLRFPGQGGTVKYLNLAFGGGVLTGAANILLLLSYVVLLAIYAYAFGSYGASLFPAEARDGWLHLLASGVIIGLLFLNLFASRLVIRTENFFNLAKLLLLAIFIIVGLVTPFDWGRMAPSQYVSPLGIISGAMLIFLNYEGFELIANASEEVENPRRSLPVAYLGGVLTVIVIYILTVVVVVGHLSFEEIRQSSDYALSVAAKGFMGEAGYLAIAVAALMATSSAINATFFSTGKLVYSIAKSGQLPRMLEKSRHGNPVEGTLIMAGISLLIVNFVPLEAIATMGSAGFLLIFMAVNIANTKLASETRSNPLISSIAALTTGICLVILCLEVEENPASRSHIWILIGMIVLSLLIELLYRGITGRRIALVPQSLDASRT